MTFPVIFRIGSLAVPAHLIFELLAYFIGFQLYLRQKRQSGDVVGDSTRWTIILAAAGGAALGSKILHHLASPTRFMENWNEPGFIMGGKTIVGGLLGGLIAVELVKRHYNIKKRTGDLFAIPLCVATFIGRIGCFLTGTADDTMGVHTDFFFAIDFGDGPRYPAPLYEMIYMVLLGAFIVWRKKRPHAQGELFALYMTGYLLFRFFCDFLKPYEVVFGLRGIQWACLLGLVHYTRVLTQMRKHKPEVLTHDSSR